MGNEVDTLGTTPRQPRQRTQGEGTGSRPAALVLRATTFLVPTITGFAIAYSILALMDPYESTFEHVVWFAIAVVVSWVTSIFLGDLIRSLATRTSLYRRANNFESEVEELFGLSMRQGNTKAVKKAALRRGHDAAFIDEALFLLTQLGDHEALTRGHSERVRAYASLIGKEIGLSESELESLNWTALLHDIGKLDVPSWLLTTEEQPTAGEWEVLRRHPEAARARLRRLESTLGESIYDGALYHHERWDGTGYPHRLIAGEIPLFGRITAIADAFDVMTHARSYKAPLTIAFAREELMSGAGTHFDPDLVAAFVRIGDEDLKAIRGWSATIAGFAVAGSRVATIGSQAAVVVATVAGAGVSSAVATELPPPAIAFESPSTTRTPMPTTSTTTTSTTTTTVATTTSIATTTTAGPRLMNLTYVIGENEYDGVAVTVDADELEVFVDGELDQSLTLEPGQREVIVILDVTDYRPGVHTVGFDLFLNGEKISTDQIAIVV